MKAIRIHAFGPTEEALQLDEIPVPEPSDGEVQIKIEAASLNRADLGLRSGNYRISADALPVVPGREFAGRIVKLGSGVSDYQVGQQVVAYPSLGGYAEYAVAKTSEIRPVPDGVTSAQAAALPTVYLTAWFGLTTDGQLKAGEWLLIQGGSSGVGNAAIQIAKQLGAHIIVTSGSEEKCRRLRQLGADVTVDVSTQDFVAEVKRVTAQRGVDVVLEMIGGEVYQKSLQTLAPNGRLISIGGAFGPNPDAAPPLTDGRKAIRFSITNYLKNNPADFTQLDEALQLVKAKKLTVIISKSFPLAEARQAHRHLQGRDHFGKVMLTMI